jgi:quercetin dioxygenase-like cupin family protein
MDFQDLAPALTSLAIAPKFLLVGDPYTLLLSGAQTNNAFALIHSICSPGFGPPPHRHLRESETFYILEGHMTFYANSTETTLGPGGVIHLPANLPHFFKNNGSSPVAMLVHVSPAGDFDRYLQTVGIPLPADYTPPAITPPPSPEHLQKVLAEGPNFGIEFLL